MERPKSPHRFSHAGRHIFGLIQRFLVVPVAAILLLSVIGQERGPSLVAASTSSPASGGPLQTADEGAVNLIFNTYNDIQWVRINGSNAVLHSDKIAKELIEATAIDYYFEKQLVCWADSAKDKIECVWLNGTKPYKKEVMLEGRIKAEGLAIDWFTEKIYWTNGESNRIELITIEGLHRKVLFWSDLDQPRGIALIPHRKMLIWSDWGDNPKIERASMDGDPDTRKVLIKESIFWPNGLTVDLETETIYWVDGKLNFLQEMKWDGSNRRTIVQNLSYPYSVTLFQQRIFWTDWQMHSINTLQNGDVKQLLKLEPQSPIAVRVWDNRLQPLDENPCRRNNGNCSHLCLLSMNEQGYTCACPTGVKLRSLTECPERPKDMLFFLQRSQMSNVSLDTPDFTSFSMNVGKIKYGIAIDYDPVEDTVYWSDGDTHSILRLKQDGRSGTEVILTDIDNVDGLAVDWLARNLYWTNTGLDRIEVSRLDGSSRRVIVNENLQEPRAIAVAPSLGWLFWSDWSEKSPKVERASLDGSERVVLVSSDIVWPNGIALDIDEKMLYWCDAKTDKIEVIGMDGSNRRVVLSENLPHVFGLSLLDDYIYWSDWQRRSIDRANKYKGSDRSVIVDQHPDLMGIKVARLDEIKGYSPCSKNNGGCSHLCLNRPKDYVCVCPIEMELANDKKTCTASKGFLFYSKSHTIGRISLEYNEGNYNDYILPLRDIKEIRTLNVDMKDGRIYWTDPKSKCISRAFINGSEAEKIVDTGVINPEGLAVDWISRNIYWTDTETKRIEVARLDGSSRRVLFWKGIEDPKHLVLDPKKGLMYWSEQQLDSIMRSQMDGTEMVKIAKKANNIGGLTIDLMENRLYWTSQDTSSRIEWIDLEGQKKRTTLVELDSKDALAITVYQDYLYWTDWNTGDIEKIDKKTGLNRSIVHKNLQFVSSLESSHEQIGTNGCSRNNGGCSHLCLPTPSGYKCACPTHFILSNDGLSCTAPKNFLIFSQKNSFGRIVANSSDAPNAPLPVMGKNIRVIEYDPIGHNLFWIDGKTIKKSSENGSKLSVIVSVPSQPFDLAYDVIGKLLFWTCAHTNSINITSIDGEPMGNIDTGDSLGPRYLAIDFLKRYIFWTDFKMKAIFRAKLDGSQRMVVVSRVPDITALAVDPQANILFYSDGKRIEKTDFLGKNNKTIVSINVNQVSSLAALQSVVYWLDEKMIVESVNYNGEGRRQETLRLKQITDIVSVWAEMKMIRNHPCLSKKNQCSHLCITNPANRTEVDICACPQGLVLMEDKRSCGTSPACGPTSFMCATPVSRELSGAWHRDCIPTLWRCDGQADCADRSDEEGCPSCHPDQFSCQSGECIDKNLVCDGTTHCYGGDDEADCCKSPQEFKCPRNNVCIPPSYLCDGWENCADGADESPEICQANSRRVVQASDKKTFIIIIVVLMLMVFFAAYIFQIWRTKLLGSNGAVPPDDQAAAPLSPVQNKTGRVSRFSSIPDVVWMSTLNGRSSANSYDRNNITGASSSTTTKGSSSLIGYPLNPPPSPATTATSTRCNSYRPYRHYKTINQPPPPTPCSTDVCDESDSNYTSKTNPRGSLLKFHMQHQYESEPYPPPPTPRSHHYHSDGMMPDESCPPSPNSRSSNNFSPLPPPPSPVPSRRYKYDK